MAQGAFSSDTTWCLDEFGHFLPEVYDWARPTVAVVLMKGNQVLLVQSSKRRDNEGVSWLLPQGGADKGVTILQALSAELWQELGLDFPASKLGELWDNRQLAVLGSYINQPRSDGDKPKLIVVVGIRVEDLDPIKLNKENTKYEFVWGSYQLWGIMATTRPRKVEGTFSAISQAHVRGLIGWSCDDVLQQLSQASAA